MHCIFNSRIQIDIATVYLLYTAPILGLDGVLSSDKHLVPARKVVSDHDILHVLIPHGSPHVCSDRLQILLGHETSQVEFLPLDAGFSEGLCVDLAGLLEDYHTVTVVWRALLDVGREVFDNGI